MSALALKEITVEAFWDEEALVWIATSDDVPGLVTEAATMEQLIPKLKILIPDLLQANAMFAEGEAAADNAKTGFCGAWEDDRPADEIVADIAPPPGKALKFKTPNDPDKILMNA